MVTEYQKPTFKVTEIGLLPKEWSISSLSTSCLLITDGSHYSPLEFENGTKFIATVYNMGENKIDVDSCKRISDKDYETLVRNGCKPVEGDVLFSKDGTVGICFPFNQKSDLVLLSSIAILRPKKILDPTFVSQYLKSDFGKKQVIGLKTGTALSRITLEKLKYIKIPIPSLPEQQKIAKILSDTDSLIESLDKLISKKRNIKQGLMKTLLTRGIGHTKFKETEIGEIPEEWECVTLGDPKISTITRAGGTPLRSVRKYYENGNIPFVKIEDMVVSGKYLTDTDEKITDEGVRNSSAWVIQPDSILYSMYASYGEVSINKLPVATNQAILSIIPNKYQIDVNYLYYQLKQLKSNLKKYLRSTTQNNLNANIVKALKIPFAPLLEQQKIAEILSDADKEIEVLEQKRYKYEMLKTGMMQQLLTGGIRVK